MTRLLYARSYNEPVLEPGTKIDIESLIGGIAAQMAALPVLDRKKGIPVSWPASAAAFARRGVITQV